MESLLKAYLMYQRTFRNLFIGKLKALFNTWGSILLIFYCASENHEEKYFINHLQALSKWGKGTWPLSPSAKCELTYSSSQLKVYYVVLYNLCPIFSVLTMAWRETEKVESVLGWEAKKWFYLYQNWMCDLEKHFTFLSSPFSVLH